MASRLSENIMLEEYIFHNDFIYIFLESVFKMQQKSSEILEGFIFSLTSIVKKMGVAYL